jgi:hypothetical protein
LEHKKSDTENQLTHITEIIKEKRKEDIELIKNMNDEIYKKIENDNTERFEKMTNDILTTLQNSQQFNTSQKMPNIQIKNKN